MGRCNVTYRQYSLFTCRQNVFHLLYCCQWVYLTDVQKVAAVWSTWGLSASHSEVPHSAGNIWGIIQSHSTAAAAAFTETTEQVSWWQPVFWWDQLSYRLTACSFLSVFCFFWLCSWTNGICSAFSSCVQLPSWSVWMIIVADGCRSHFSQ